MSIKKKKKNVINLNFKTLLNMFFRLPMTLLIINSLNKQTNDNACSIIHKIIKLAKIVFYFTTGSYGVRIGPQT